MPAPPDAPPPPALVTDDDRLSETIVTPTLDEPLTRGRNVLFCSTFQLAWNELKELLGGPVQLEEAPPLAESLNRGEPTAADIDAASHVARAGFGPRVLGEIERALVETFGPRDDFALPQTRLRDDEIMAYAYLLKSLSFGHPFAVDKTTGLRFGFTSVQCFGLWEDVDLDRFRQCAPQVFIHHYGHSHDFVLELLTDTLDDRLIVARLEPRETLLDTATVVAERARGGRSLFHRLLGAARLAREDVLKIPLVDLAVRRLYRELVPRKLADRELVISDARQRIRLKLDEKGALLVSSADVAVLRSAVPKKGRYLVCDGPFLLLLMRRGRSLPYLAVWVETPELLVRATPATPAA